MSPVNVLRAVRRDEPVHERQVHERPELEHRGPEVASRGQTVDEAEDQEDIEDQEWTAQRSQREWRTSLGEPSHDRDATPTPDSSTSSSGLRTTPSER